MRNNPPYGIIDRLALSFPSGGPSAPGGRGCPQAGRAVWGGGLYGARETWGPGRELAATRRSLHPTYLPLVAFRKIRHLAPGGGAAPFDYRFKLLGKADDSRTENLFKSSEPI